MVLLERFSLYLEALLSWENFAAFLRHGDWPVQNAANE